MPIKNVFEEIVSFENLLRAEKEVGSGKRGQNPNVLKFREDLENNLFELRDRMLNLDLPKPKYHIFYVFEPKVRKVIDIDYKNKIIQRAIYDVINPLVCKGFITDTYSCIKGRGQLAAMLRLYEWEKYVSRKSRPWYYLKSDITKFFYRIPHDELCCVVNKKIWDKRAAALILFYILDNSIPFGLPLNGSPLETPMDEMLWDMGITIGGGLSHMLGNMYLDPLDQFIKRTLGADFYARYMDDGIILSDDKLQLHKWQKDIEDFLWDELRLNLNNKTMICPIDKGVEWVGCRIWPTHVTIRKSTSLRMKRRLRLLQRQYAAGEVTFERVTQTVNSYKAMMKHCDCHNLDKKIFTDFVLTRNTEGGI